MQEIAGILLVVLGAAEPVSPPAAQIEKQVVDYRRSIQRAHVVWHQETYEFPGGKRTLSRSRATTIWLDGSQVRTDIRLSYSGSALHREVYGRNCEADGYYVNWSDQDVGNGKTIAVSFDIAKESKAALVPMMVIDPRTLGMYPESSPNLSKKHLESFVGRQDRENMRVKSADWRGRTCWLIEYKILEGVGIGARVWVVPEWGPSVARMEAEWKVPDAHFVDSVECDYAQHKPSQIWYPSSCTYRRTKDGNPLEEETVRAEVLSLNEALSPDAFRLAGMGIPPKTAVSGYPGMAMRACVWDGKQVACAKEEPELTPIPLSELEAEAGARRMRLLATAVGFALLAGLCLWLYVRRLNRRET